MEAARKRTGLYGLPRAFWREVGWGMDPATFLRTILRPALGELAHHGGPAVSRDAERFLLAIALQESNATARYQNSPAEVPGPARGFWQFESIAVQEMLTNRLTAVLAKESCERALVVPSRNAVHRAIEGHDRLAVVFARLLVLTLPPPLPTTEADGWSQYLQAWRPGKPHRERWGSCWQLASAATLVPEVSHADPAPGTV